MKRFSGLPNLKDRRRELRKDQTKQEKLLWWHLKDRNLGFKFKRQHSIGGYIADFYCAEKKLVIELDGEIHLSKESQEYDKIRDSFFKELGFSVVRFLNSEIDSDIYKILTIIKVKLESI